MLIFVIVAATGGVGVGAVVVVVVVAARTSEVQAPNLIRCASLGVAAGPREYPFGARKSSETASSPPQRERESCTR